jgi:DNA-binding MarR family transcriptional regulator
MAKSRGTRARPRIRSSTSTPPGQASATGGTSGRPMAAVGKPPLGIDLEHFIPWLATSLTRYLHGVMTEAMAPLGVSIPEWRVILCLFDGRSYTLTEVVEFTSLNQSSLSRAIVRMEKKGIVTRARRTHDARLMSIGITPAGRALCERASLAVREACDRELGVLSQLERDSFVRITRKLLAELPPPKRAAGLSY